MKKLVSTLLVTSLGFSIALAKDEVSTKQSMVVAVEKTEQYNIALNYFRNNNFKKSYEMFYALFEKNLSNTLVNFYLGRSAFELGNYEVALAAYERILISEPNNTRVRLELAHTYMKMKNYDESKKEFKLALLGQMPIEVRKKVEQNIIFMENKTQKHFFDVTTMLGIMYDSNIDATPTADSFQIYSPALNTNLTLNSGKERSSTIYQALGYFNYKYKIDDNWMLDNSLTALQMKYINNKDKDLGVISLNLSPSYLTQGYKFSIGVLYDKVLLGHKTYQNNYYLNPKYTTVLNEKTIYETSLKLGRINYKQDKNRSANLAELVNSIKYLTKDFGVFTFDATLGKEFEIKDARTDVENLYFEFGVSNSYELVDTYTLLSGFKYKQKMYDEVDVNFSSKREDKKYDISLGVQKIVSKNIFLNTGITYTDNSSNHPSSDYDKYTVKANLFYSF